MPLTCAPTRLEIDELLRVTYQRRVMSTQLHTKHAHNHAHKHAVSKWDIWGMIISGLCIVHCMAVPLVLLLAPTIAAQFFPSEDWTHVILLAFILGVAGISFVSGYRVHGQWRPVAWLVAGLSLVVYATFFAHKQLGHYFEPIFAIAGSACLIRAHILNHHCKKCHVEHEHHRHAEEESQNVL